MDLNQITVYSANVPEAAKFYQTLGFRLIVDSMPRYARFECGAGDSTFSLHESEDDLQNNSVVIYLECDDVDREFERLLKAGIEFQKPPEKRPWLWREAHFQDPDGNRLILYHAGENRKNPPWRIE